MTPRERSAPRDPDGPADPPGTAPGGPERAAALARVRAVLRRSGVTDAEIDEAVAGDALDLLAVDRLLAPAGARYTTEEVSAASGLSVVQLQRIWRALGFLEPPAGDRALTELDVEAARLFRSLVDLGITDVETGVHLARVIGSSMARIAEAGVARVATVLGAGDDSVLAADAFAGSAGEVLPAMDRLLAYVWRRHVQAVTRRTMLLRTHGRLWGTRQDVAVGFADMVGFTVLSQHLGQEDLAAVVQRFEEVASDIVTALGGRVVKMIGDEAMFVVEDTVAAAHIAVALSEAYADDDLLRDVRVGLSAGPVLVNDGDYFGPPVNLASRIVNIASPGTVLVSDEVHRRVVERDDGSVRFEPLGRRQLKDVGPVTLWWCGRAGTVSPGPGSPEGARRRSRWDRLTDMLRDGEQSLGSGGAHPQGGDPPAP